MTPVTPQHETMAFDGRLLVISPHLDDAVLSCGLLLAAHPASVVCTVFAAAPDDNMVTDWDRASGFTDAFEAMRARKLEDDEALAALNARPIHLAFRDAQYQSPPAEDRLLAALQQTVCKVEPSIVLIPMGLFHSDHTIVSDACLALMRGFNDALVLAYEDIPYRTLSGAVQQRLSVLTERRVLASPVDAFDATIEAARHHRSKQTAIAAYQSQLRAFGPHAQADLDMPERYWRLRDMDKAGRALI